MKYLLTKKELDTVYGVYNCPFFIKQTINTVVLKDNLFLIDLYPNQILSIIIRLKQANNNNRNIIALINKLNKAIIEQ